MLFFSGLHRSRKLAITFFFLIAILRFRAYFGSDSSLSRSITCWKSTTISHHLSPHAPTRCLLSPESGPRTPPPHSGLAPTLLPAELLCRPTETFSKEIPKLLHQSWKSRELPAKFKKWSDTCRKQHPDWEWVLWTDEDNLQLVKDYFPWLEDTFVSLPGNIYRADLARNLYMYMFGGVYADLDTECLRPTLDALVLPNISLHHKPEEKSSDKASVSGIAVFGRMGADSTFDHHVPNAWMAASPRHPFFLLPLKFAQSEIQKSRRMLHRLWYDYPSAEQLTGPIALHKNIRYYELCGDTKAKIILLPDGLIYPFNWNTGEELRSICSAEKDTFNEEQCKETLGVNKKGSVSITYWSHTHRGKGPDTENIERISQET